MWKVTPTELIQVDINDVDCILALDENGIPSLKKYDCPNTRYFTITGVQICSEDFLSIKNSIVNLKNKYWQNGSFKDERVVFHAREIRKKEYSFNPKIIDYAKFIEDLEYFLENAPVKIYASTVDKKEHHDTYKYNAYPVYDLALTFILERYAYDLNRSQKKGIVLLESRGKKEDKNLLKQINKLFKYGNSYNKPEIFRNISAVYFNRKRTKDKKLSYWQLELADLYAYSIHKYTKTGVADTRLNKFKNKIYAYPYHKGKGLKLFPGSLQKRIEKKGVL